MQSYSYTPNLWICSLHPLFYNAYSYAPNLSLCFPHPRSWHEPYLFVRNSSLVHFKSASHFACKHITLCMWQWLKKILLFRCPKSIMIFMPLTMATLHSLGYGGSYWPYGHVPPSWSSEPWLHWISSSPCGFLVKALISQSLLLLLFCPPYESLAFTIIAFFPVGLLVKFLFF